MWLARILQRGGLLLLLFLFARRTIALLVRDHSGHGKFQRFPVFDQTACIVVTCRAGELLRAVAESVEFEDEMEILELGRSCCLDFAGVLPVLTSRSVRSVRLPLHHHHHSPAPELEVHQTFNLPKFGSAFRFISRELFWPFTLLTPPPLQLEHEAGCTL